MLKTMLKDIHFLILGNILLAIGQLAFISSNIVIAYLATLLAICCFIRQLFKHPPKKQEDNTTIK
jgi:hypothetical protein